MPRSREFDVCRLAASACHLLSLSVCCFPFGCLCVNYMAIYRGLLLVIWLLVVAVFHLVVCQLTDCHLATWMLVTCVLIVAWTCVPVRLLLVT